MRHEPRIVTVADVCNGWREDNAPWWSGLDDTEALDAAREAIDAADQDDDGFQSLLDAESALEADYLKAHGKDRYEVTWPEHCISERLCSDAYFRKL